MAITNITGLTNLWVADTEGDVTTEDVVVGDILLVKETGELRISEQNGQWSKTKARAFEMLHLTQGTMQQHDSTADLEIEWKTQDKTSSYFSHDTESNPEQITCLTNGWLDIRYAIHYDEDDGARLTTTAYLEVNGTPVGYTTGNRSYYRGLNYSRWGTAYGSFYLPIAEDDVIVLHSGVADTGDFGLTREIDTVPDITFIQLRYVGV